MRSLNQKVGWFGYIAGMHTEREKKSNTHIQTDSLPFMMEIAQVKGRDRTRTKEGNKIGRVRECKRAFANREEEKEGIKNASNFGDAAVRKRINKQAWRKEHLLLCRWDKLRRFFFCIHFSPRASRSMSLKVVVVVDVLEINFSRWCI